MLFDIWWKCYSFLYENVGTLGAGTRRREWPTRSQVENNLEEWGFSPVCWFKTYRLKIYRRPVPLLCEVLGCPTFGLMV